MNFFVGGLFCFVYIDGKCDVFILINILNIKVGVEYGYEFVFLIIF